MDIKKNVTKQKKFKKNKKKMNYVKMNVRVYLDIPFDEKYEAKELGCRWDPERKSWYCIDSDYGKSNVTKCVEYWGSKAYKIINGSKIKLDDIPKEKRGFTSFTNQDFDHNIK